ncbi:MAG: 2-hydroxyacyl-CoA dehydratase [Oscillospiraceae bacterium]|nr:2-hydroxyacyl-CoA dehydratase [Oscillospiraceae bacterium]
MENKLNLPANFESYPEMRKKGFLRMKELKESGKNVVGLFCSFVPLEIVWAAGVIPVGLCSFTDESIPAAEAHLPKNLCPLIKASYGFALTDTCPYFYFSDLVVGETTCDGKKKMFELMNEIKPTYVMQLPHSRDKDALAFWKGQIISFKEKMEQHFGITITEDAIREAIRMKNHERRIMREYLELGKLDPAPMSGYEMGTRIDAGSFSFDLMERCRIVEARIAEVKEKWENEMKGKPSVKPRILVTGCPNAGVRDKVIKAVEEMGADIVAFDTCSGIRDKIEMVDENNPDVYEALAIKYLNINCSVMSPNDSRIEYVAKMIDEYHVDGVIEIVLQSCHTYDVEAHFIKRMVTQDKGIPYLNIETDYSQSDKGQINTRLAAFLETIEK